MGLFWEDKQRSLRIYEGDAIDTMKSLDSGIFQTCITSPPYWAIRDYEHEDQIGLEDDMYEYIDNLVAVFDEVYRVLREDGTLWLNIADIHLGGGRAGNNPEYHERHKMFGKAGKDPSTFGKPVKTPDGLKERDLAGLPWRVAFALQDSGWYLRSDIIWDKGMSGMPLSVTNRCTTSHEYIFMLSKIPSGYYYDIDAIRNESGSNKRSVWSVPTAKGKHGHRAAYPKALIEPCVLAGCPRERCAACGAPYRRVVETGNSEHHAPPSFQNPKLAHRNEDSSDWAGYGQFEITRVWTDEFRASCDCVSEVEIGECIDPFGGSGTTAVVAAKNGRGCTLCELNSDFCKIAKKRINEEASQAKLF